MKRLFVIILVLSFVLSCSAALADRYIFGHYSLFIDGDFYNSFFKAGFDFDTQMYDFYLYDDFSGGLFSSEKWVNGQRICSGWKEVKYTKLDPGFFQIVFDDNSFFNGYWDEENDEDLWICLAGNTYYRFSCIHSFDIQKDMVTK